MMSKNPSWLTVGYKIWLHNVPFIITNIESTKYIEITDSEGIKSKHDLLALYKSGHLVLTDPALVVLKPEQVIEASPNELQRMHSIAHDLQLLDNTKRGQKLNLISDLAKKYDVSDRQVHRWQKLYQEKGLVGLQSKTYLRGNSGKNMLPEETEQAIQEGIKDYLLTRTPISKDECIRLIRSKCSILQIHVPSPGAIRNRINQIPEKSILKAQKGLEHANDTLRVSRDAHNTVTRPLQEVQTDHSPLDLLIVDPNSGDVIGRPTLTVIIDVYTRIILGIYIGWEHPSFDNLSWALKEAIFKKDDLIEKYKINGEWPTYGLMETLDTDNGGEFDGDNLDFFIEENMIDKGFRPKGQKHFGGHVERVIGTIQQYIHTLPGTTFSNTKSKGDYNAEKEAVLNLEEVRGLVYRWIVERYHNNKRDELFGSSPLEKWRNAVEKEGWKPRLPDNEESLRRSLLPSQTKTISKNGISLFNEYYTSPGLTHWKALETEKSQKYRVHYDTRDMRWAYFVNPDGNGVTKLSSTTLKSTVPITLKELQNIKAGNQRYPTPTPHLYASHEQDLAVINNAKQKKSKKTLRAIARQADATNRVAPDTESAAIDDNIDYTSLPDWAKELEDDEC